MRRHPIGRTHVFIHILLKSFPKALVETFYKFNLIFLAGNIIQLRSPIEGKYFAKYDHIFPTGRATLIFLKGVALLGFIYCVQYDERLTRRGLQKGSYSSESYSFGIDEINRFPECNKLPVLIIIIPLFNVEYCNM